MEERMAQGGAHRPWRSASPMEELIALAYMTHGHRVDHPCGWAGSGESLCCGRATVVDTHHQAPWSMLAPPRRRGGGGTT